MTQKRNSLDSVVARFSRFGSIWLVESNMPAEIKIDFYNIKLNKLDIRMKELKLFNSPLSTVVDDDVYERYKEAGVKITGNGYSMLDSVLFHHIILEPKEGYIVSHKDNNKLNNLRENLEYKLKSLACENIVKENKTSKYRGVYKKRNKWCAKYKKKYLGQFDTEEEAHACYEEHVKRENEVIKN